MHFNKKILGGAILPLFLFIAAGCSLDAGGKTTVEIGNIEQSSQNSSSTDFLPDSAKSQESGNGMGLIATGSSSADKIKIEIPSRLEIDAAFAQQAPFANWDALHEEACEEASMIIADKYFKHEPLDETVMENAIQDLVKWEGENGYQVDLTARETVDILNNYFGLKAKVSTEVTVDRIKYELAQGNLVLVPAAGRELGNPNFKQPGPIYHMLVIKGYSGGQFITNDPGTRKGDGWRYDYDVLINAVHDWNHDLAQNGMTDAEMGQGAKIMIIVEK